MTTQSTSSDLSDLGLAVRPLRLVDAFAGGRAIELASS